MYDCKERISNNNNRLRRKTNSKRKETRDSICHETPEPYKCPQKGKGPRRTMAVEDATKAYQTVESLFDSLAPPGTDETVRAYVCSLLEEIDHQEDADGLISTLQGVLGGGDDDEGAENSIIQPSGFARELVHRWMEQKSIAAQPSRTTTKTKPATYQVSHPPLSLAAENPLHVGRPESPTRQPVPTSPSLSPNNKKRSGRKTRQQRKEERMKRRSRKSKQKPEEDEDGNTSDSSGGTPTYTNWADKDDDDFATAWNECKEQGELWGGRGRGGRGVQAGSNSIRSNIHLDNVTVSVPGGGLELLDNATIDLARGHRYGLVGRNGCGE